MAVLKVILLLQVQQYGVKNVVEPPPPVNDLLGFERQILVHFVILNFF